MANRMADNNTTQSTELSAQLAELMTLWEKTTQGEWKWVRRFGESDSEYCCCYADDNGTREDVIQRHSSGLIAISESDARLIEESKNAFPAIAARLRDLESENLEWLRAARLIECSDSEEKEREGFVLLNAMRLDRSYLDTPLPVVERLMKDMTALKAENDRLKAAIEKVRKISEGAYDPMWAYRIEDAVNQLDAGGELQNG